jgi:cobalt transporter subunit CbtB
MPAEAIAAPPVTAIAAGRAAAARRLAAALAFCLGGLLLWGTGFAHFDLLHNAAHDTRHSNGFPCH